MKVIDLYKLIANKEYDKLPQKIMLKGYDYIFSLREDCTGYKWYGEVNTHDDFEETIHQNLEFILNCEITIFELEDLQKENEHLRTQVNTYENPDDYTLFYMWFDAKAKDKMKQLQEENERLKEKENKLQEKFKDWKKKNRKRKKTLFMR